MESENIKIVSVKWEHAWNYNIFNVFHVLLSTSASFSCTYVNIYNNIYILYIYIYIILYLYVDLLWAVWHDIWNLNFALYSFFSEATIPPKSYAGRFVKHFSEHVIEVDEVLETAFHCALWWLNRVLWKIDENCPFSSMIWLLRMVIFHCKQLKV